MNTKIQNFTKTAKIGKKSSSTPKSTKVKGFTLIELIIVLAIISVLVAVAMMNMMRWIGEARTKNANSESKLLFNSVQTVIQDYNTRNMGNESALDEFKKDPNIFDEIHIVYNGDRITNFTIYNPASPDTIKSANLTTISEATARAKAQNYMNNFLHDLQRYYSEARNYAWTVYIQNGLVVEAMCTENPNWKYNGSYPYQLFYDQINNGFNANMYESGTWTSSDVYPFIEDELRYSQLTPSAMVTLRNLYIRSKNSQNGTNEAPFMYTGLAE